MTTITITHLLGPLKGVEFAFAGPCCCSLPKYFGYSQFTRRKRNVALTPQRNASVLPKIKAQNSLGYFSDSNFYKVEAILRPWRIPHVSSVPMDFNPVPLSGFDVFGENSRVPVTAKLPTRTHAVGQFIILSDHALLKMGIRGVTVSDVKGFGAQGGSKERHGGSEFYEDNFVAKVKMEIVVSKDQVEAVVDKIIEVARTGEIGDGKIFLIPVADVIRVRTGERGEKAERMSGGRADMFSVV